MTAQRTTLAALEARLAALPGDRRQLLAIAGPPGAGKSTVADRLAKAVNAADPGRAAVLAMDGYHFDDAVLREMGRFARKGAPDTFDVGGLASMLARLRANAEAEIAVPVFDRAIEIARAGARIIPQSVGLVLVEGNYLLAGVPPWDALRPLFDVGVLIEVGEAELERRLRARWVHYGLDEAGIRAKLEDNDLPNGRFVLRESRGADLILATET